MCEWILLARGALTRFWIGGVLPVPVCQRMLFLCGLPEDGYCLGAMGYVELAGELGSNHLLSLEALHIVMVSEVTVCEVKGGGEVLVWGKAMPAAVVCVSVCVRPSCLGPVNYLESSCFSLLSSAAVPPPACASVRRVSGSCMATWA